MCILILAGGSGSRLWPVSRKNNPKQILELFDRQTMIEKTWDRLRKQYDAEDIFICTNGASASFIKRKLKGVPKNNLIIEPVVRGSTAAIGFGAWYIKKRYGDTPIIVIGADAYIEDDAAYLRVLREVEKILKQNTNATVLVGIKPTYAETGYGYIKIRNLKLKSKVLPVERFIEKPSLRHARRFVRHNGYFWNPAIFGWNSAHLVRLYEHHVPRTYHALARIFGRAVGSKKQKAGKNFLAKEFLTIDTTPVEYSILEKEKNLFVVPANFVWADIGHWRAIHEILRGRPDQNVVRGTHVHVDSSGNLIYSAARKLVATAGVKDMVIIETKDAILICPRDRSQDVKKITELLNKKKLTKYL